MKKHVNIPIFIPHLGCPNQCVFCNQRTISGVNEFLRENVIGEIEEALRTVSPDAECEIAFFGGSFTGIQRDLMIYLLKVGNSFIKSGKVSSIRCSTRPDYIDKEILDILKDYGVRTIELGLQSTDDQVLLATKRGHTAADAAKACELIVDNGFSLVGQMMIGLPCSTRKSEEMTANFIISSGASEARIYPTVVFYGTELCDLAKTGKYSPLSLDDAIERTASVKRKLVDAGVKVIRVGLCSSDNLISDATYFAGPNHSALGELVENKIYLDAIFEELANYNAYGKDVEIFVKRGSLSKAIGQRQINKKIISSDFSLKNVKFIESDYLEDYRIKLKIF